MKKERNLIFLSVALCCAAMAVVDIFIKLPYFARSGVKIFIFLLVPILFARYKKLSLLDILKPDRRSVLLGAVLGVGTFAVIIGGYALLAPFLDLSGIPAALEKNVGVTRENFPIVAIYIALCNSLLEEFFFRGFSYLALKKVSDEKTAMIFSAAAFSVYHAAIMDGWMSFGLTAALLLALFGCGIFFNFLDRRSERIWASWLPHLCANLAINSIGMMLLMAA